MKKLLKLLFGEHSDNVLIIREDGQDWALVRDLCDMMDIQNEYHAVEDQYTRPQLNLNDADKRQFYVPQVKGTCEVWFVSESGVWKIVGRSRSSWAESFRANIFTRIFPKMYKEEIDVRP